MTGDMVVREGGAIRAFDNMTAFEDAQRMAVALSESELVPKAYQGPRGVPNILIALDMAARMDLHPLDVMRNLHVIHGSPGWKTEFLIGRVNTSGRFTPLRWVETFDDEGGSTGLRCTAIDIASGEECVGPAVTYAMAKAEGWTDRKGSKWKTMPEVMLRYRAAAFWVRNFAPEISLGMKSTDELSDIGAPAGPIPTVVAEILDESDDVATGDELTRLGELLSQATGMKGAIVMQERNDFEAVLVAQDGPGVRQAIATLSERVEGAQGALL